MGPGLWAVGASLLAALAIWVRVMPPPDRGGERAHPDLAESLARRWGALVEDRSAPPVAQLLDALVAELRAGQPTRMALELACAGLSPPPCPQARQAAVLGGDVAAALRRDASSSGAGALRGLAACWEVAEHSGAGLADAVGRLAEGHRAARRADEQLSAEVAAARASARILALLPLFGLVIGQWIGAQPLGWLTGTWAGRLALLVGGLLQAAGLLWLHRMTAGVRARLEP
jgi:tight adherence protein B